MPLKLPRLPYEQKQYTPQIVTFGGVNYSQNHRDGELSDCRNLSSREFPCLSQRLGRKAVEGYDGCTAVYDYFGKLIVCAGGRLYMDGKELCDVLDGPKQFAVVNSQLVIWPDKLVISLTEERVLQDCAAIYTADHESTVYDDESITAPVDVPTNTGTNSYLSAGSTGYTVYTYGYDKDKVKACWKNGAWDADELSKLEILKKITALKVSEIMLPDADGNMITGYTGAAPDKSGQNTTGHFCVVDSVYGNTGNGGQWTVQYSLYQVGVENVPFYRCYAPGDRIDVSGGEFGLTGTAHGEIREIDAKSNKITFVSSLLRVPVLYSTAVQERIRAGSTVCFTYTYSYQGSETKQDLSAVPGEDIPAGCVLFCTAQDVTEYSVNVSGNKVIYGYTVHHIRLWDPEKKTEYGPYGLTSLQEREIPESAPVLTNYPAPHELQLQRALPKLDYICSSDNRLWGVSNADKTIWGSGLGKPFDFFTYAGLSTDSYAVPVGSDGDFTGCIGYGGNVLFWKEDKLHKLLGTAPENYQLYEYTVRGLMDGCHKSQVIINETLFFKSRDGVCAYTGSVPSLISENFGVRRFRDATAGTDDEKYYISMRDTRTDAWGLWVFDPATGLWLQEGAERVLDFANLDGTLYMLMDGGRVLMAGQTDADEEIEWEATFCEMTEQHHERKCYSRLLLRMDMEPGAFCRGEISTDGGPFRKVGSVHGARNKTGELLIHPENCDRFQIRLKGRGRCRVKSLIREFTFGGER